MEDCIVYVETLRHGHCAHLNLEGVMKKRNRKTALSPLSDKAVHDLERTQRRYNIFDRLFDSEKYRRALLPVYRANARDYHRSQKLETALATLETADIVDFPVANGLIGGDWKPFRVERGLTSSMRGEISCRRFTGTMTTNMLDSSSVVFLKNADGETMRVLLPSPATAKEMLAQSIENWRSVAGFVKDYSASWSEQDQDTHTSGVIHRFARSSNWTDALTHPDVIDMLDASCQAVEEQRPRIRLFGGLVQKGVALGAAIEVNGVQSAFVPTGFFKALASSVQKYVPGAQEPRLIAA